MCGIFCIVSESVMFRTRAEKILSLVPKPGIGSDDELDRELDEEEQDIENCGLETVQLSWTDEQIDAGIQDLFQYIQVNENEANDTVQPTDIVSPLQCDPDLRQIISPVQSDPDVRQTPPSRRNNKNVAKKPKLSTKGKKNI